MALNAATTPALGVPVAPAAAAPPPRITPLNRTVAPAPAASRRIRRMRDAWRASTE
jgi:hypothetical protein